MSEHTSNTDSPSWAFHRNPLRAPDGRWRCRLKSRFEYSGSFTARFHCQPPLLPGCRLHAISSSNPSSLSSPSCPSALRLLCRNRQPQGNNFLSYQSVFHRRTYLFIRRSFRRWRGAPSWHNFSASSRLLVPPTPNPCKSPFGAVPILLTSYASTQS